MTSLAKPGPASLRDLYELPEPIVSVYFRMEDPAGDDVALRRRMIRHHLQRAATGTAALRAVENALAEVPRGTGAVAAFIGRDGSEHRFDLPEAYLVDRVSRAAVPDVAPFIRWRQYRPPYVLAVLNDAGTEISVRRSSWSEAVTTTAATPDETIEALSDSGARLLMLTGDTQAVQHFHDELPEWARQHVEVAVIPGGPGTEPPELSLDRTIHAIVDARMRKAVEHVIAESKPGGLGVQGIPAVINALALGRLRALLVGPGPGPGPGPDTDTAAWFGPGPTDLAEHRSGLALPEADRRHGPVADVLIRAATLTDVEVWIAPFELSEDLHQGVGGICRSAG